MIIPLGRLILSGALLFWTAAFAAAQPKAGDDAPDFPVGQFTDGKSHRLADYRGKVIVLFFYESQCPRCKGLIPDRNDVVKAFEGKPVVFLAVAAGDNLASAAAYGKETGLQMPIFADNLGLMEARYGQKISLNNIWQFRVIGPDGKIVGFTMTEDVIQKALEKAEAKFDQAGYDAKLKPAAEAFERRQWEAGMKLLTPLRKSSTKAVAESANKLYEAVKSEGETWKSQAEQAAESDPVKAYDLSSRLVAVFPSEPAFKDAAESKRKLANGKAVIAELAARKAYSAFLGSLASAAPGQEAQVAKLAQAFVKKHPGTPTAERVAELEKELPKKP
jgi:peroxiredoxin